jgi:hypothetical protein
MPSNERDPRASIIAEGPKSSGGPPSSGRTPADFVAWGPVRDAVTSIHNLEALLKSPRVAIKVLASVLPDFLGSVTLLRGAFGASVTRAQDPEANDAREALAAFALARLDELDGAMHRASDGELDARGRLALEQVVTRVSADLDAAAELLDLANRAEHAAPMELSLDGLARVSVRPVPRGESEVLVRLQRATADCLMSTDAHVLTRLLAFAAARAHAHGAEHVTIRAGCAATHARIRVEKSAPGDSSLTPLAMRLVRRIAPTDAIVASAARGAGIGIDVDGGAVTFTIPRAGSREPGDRDSSDATMTR